MVQYLMPWYEREQFTPFDALPIAGMTFLHGDVMAKRYHQLWVEGKKYPLITFPSGLTREIGPQNGQKPIHAINVFGALHLPYATTRDEAWTAARRQAVQHGYSAIRQGERDLIVMSPGLDRGYQVRYDNARREITNVLRFPAHAMDLLDGESRAVLPPLYHNEPVGLEAVAPVKFFGPDNGWVWYPTEYDGQELFFGLVSGYEVELGYFSLTELESVRGPLGLPLERDLYYEPRTLRELQDLHHRGERG
jgi:DUF2958 family protein